MRDEDLKEFSNFLVEFQAETDRGAALVGAALLDLKLLEILRAFFIEGDTTEALLDGGNAPLGTLSSRIKASYSLGLIDSHELHECEIIRKVRNEFAHRAHGLAFTDKKINDQCLNLKSDLPGGEKANAGNARKMFINAVLLTILRLTYRSEYVARERRATKAWPY